MSLLKKFMAFAGMVVGSFLVFLPSAMAAETGAVKQLLATDANDAAVKQYVALAAGLCIALAAFGGALAQGKAVTATMEGIARNPGAAGKMFVPMILGLALIESLVIYALVISFSLIGQLG